MCCGIIDLNKAVNKIILSKLQKKLLNASLPSNIANFFAFYAENTWTKTVFNGVSTKEWLVNNGAR